MPFCQHSCRFGGPVPFLLLTPSEITCPLVVFQSSLWPGADVISGPLRDNISFCEHSCRFGGPVPMLLLTPLRNNMSSCCFSAHPFAGKSTTITETIGIPERKPPCGETYVLRCSSCQPTTIAESIGIPERTPPCR